MIRFIYGESGYGKTHSITELLKKDAEEGVRSFLLVPEQYAVMSERIVLDELPASAQLGIEILNFSRLYNRVCREYGGLEYNYITKPAKYLLMRQTLRELSDCALLEHYSSAAADGSLGEIMLGAIGEFKANGINSAQLERAAESLEKDSELYGKLRDISLIYSAYTAAVSERFSDSSDDISKLADMLGEHNFFAGCNVYIDSFTSFTAAEHRVIERIFATAENTTVTLSLPCEGYESIYTASISASERKLIENANKRGGYVTETLTKNMRARSAELVYLAENLWSLDNNTPLKSDEKTDGAVYLELCATPYAEAEAAARWALSLMQSGVRCRDICVIVRNPEKYRGIIEPAFERNGIPFFFSEKSDLCSKSAVKFILSALRIKNHGWKRDDVISHIKTGLYDISKDSVDLFEIYVNTWNISGKSFRGDEWDMNPDGYTDAISERGENILAAANSVKSVLCEKLIPFFDALDAAKNAADMSRAIYEYTVLCGMEASLRSIGLKYAERGNMKEAQESAALYGVILKALALIAETIPDADISTEELSGILKLIFDMTEIGSIPTSVDEVTIGSAAMLRANNPRCALVLGLNEGEFPQTVSDADLLNSPERKKLAELGLELFSNADTKASDELMFVKKAFSLPSERLVLFASLCGTDGKEKTPSLPFTRAEKLIENAVTHSFRESDLTYLAVSPKTAAAYAYSQEHQPFAASVRQALLEASDEYSFLRSPEKPKLDTDECGVSAEIASAVFPKNMSLSQSRLEKYVKCNFNYYCSYVLSLREDKKATFKSSDMGTFVHFVLEELIKTTLGQDGCIDELDDEKLEELIEVSVNRYIELICPESERRSGRLTHLYRRLKNLSLLLVKNIIEEFSHSKFTPSFFEYKIGERGSGAKMPEFVLSNGDKISMNGVIDRVDLLRKDGKVYVRIVDYKTGTKNFSLDDLSLGLNTQMLIYLFALCAKRSDGSESTAIPAGVVYLSSNISTIELGDYTDAQSVCDMAQNAFDRSGLLLDDEEILESMNDELSPKFLAGIKKDKKGALSGKALMSADAFELLRDEVERTIISIAEKMKSGQANAIPLTHKGESPCDWCAMKPVCRRIERKEFPSADEGDGE
ncbi:MAG: PD-(D/E)XK nuclease family protein [Clostridia bacterium]|nr:PD-(D/E)XK nuclease family protein [Clostridia bacterium]